jgi:hypothetical protein
MSTALTLKSRLYLALSLESIYEISVRCAGGNYIDGGNGEQSTNGVNMDKERLARKLRYSVALPPSATDDEILAATEGTLLRAAVELRMALHELRVAFVTALREDWARIRRLFKRG